MPTSLVHALQPGWTFCNRTALRLIMTIALFVAPSVYGVQAQTTAQLSLTGPSTVRLGGYAQYEATVSGAATPVVWLVDRRTGGNSDLGLISTSGMYSPTATIEAGRRVTIAARTVSEPVSSARIRVTVLKPLPAPAAGVITQRTSANNYALTVQGSGFVSTSQLQSGGVNVAAVLVSSTELQGKLSLPVGTSNVTAEVLNPNADQNTPATITLPVHVTAPSASLTALSCSVASVTGAGTSACLATLSFAAANGGLSLTLTSSNAAVIVPATILVPANAASAPFTATVSSVSSTQTATIIASAGGVSRSFALQLNASTPTLTTSLSSISFGNAAINTPVTQPLTLSATGTAPVTITSATLSGPAFTMSGATFPVTLSPGLAVTLAVQFNPASAGPATGTLSIQSTSSTNGMAMIGLSGTGTPHQVALNWNAPVSSAVPIASYNIYRATGGSSAYQLLKSSVGTQTAYVDQAVQTGVTYDYVVTSVDSIGKESGPSNEVIATIP